MTPETIFETYAFVVGLCVGSFLNVVIYRMPMNQSVVSPPSRCPECGVPIRYYDNIPLVSWLWLTGLCRDCGVTISPRYFLVELFTGIITLAVAQTFGMTIPALIYAIFIWGLIAITFIDIDFQIIPDELSLGGLVVGLLVAAFLPIGWQGAMIGAALGGGIFYLLAVFYPGGMGGGDIKMIAAIGAFIGWQGVAMTIMLASISGALIGICAMIFYGKGRKSKIPFGPFLALGGAVSLFWGIQIQQWYFQLLTNLFVY